MSECVFMSRCVFYGQGWNEAPYCVKHGKYLDNGCGDCKPVTVDDMATGNVVEVVRCKDCKHRDPYDLKCDHGLMKTELPVGDDDYCSYGEKNDTDTVGAKDKEE